MRKKSNIHGGGRGSKRKGRNERGTGGYESNRGYQIVMGRVQTE
jgi:hypothetical protein